MRVILSAGLVVVLVAIWAFDVYSHFNATPNDSVSRTLFEWSTRWPVLPFAMGIVFGHILWPQ